MMKAKTMVLISCLAMAAFIGTGCQVLNKVAWSAIDMDGDQITRELGQAQREFVEGQTLVVEALGIKDKVQANLADAQTHSTGVDGTMQKNAAGLKKASTSSKKVNDAIEEALKENPELNEDQKKLMAEANTKFASATTQMAVKTAVTVGLCIKIKDLITSDSRQHQVVGAILIIPAISLASHVIKDAREFGRTAKLLRQFSKKQGVEVTEDTDFEDEIGKLDEYEDDVPTDKDKPKTE